MFLTCMNSLENRDLLTKDGLYSEFQMAMPLEHKYVTGYLSTGDTSVCKVATSVTIIRN